MRPKGKLAVALALATCGLAFVGCEVVAGIEDVHYDEDAGASDASDTNVADFGGETASDTRDTGVVAETSETSVGDSDASVVDSGDSGADALPDTTVPPDTSVADTRDTSVADTSVACPSTGQTMVRVTRPTGGSFCIDQDEVTTAAMATFSAAVFVPSSPPSRCVSAGIPKWDKPIDVTDNQQPAYNVMWCQAWSYCQWAGKRLCSVVDTASAASDSNSEYAYACGQGTKSYPYSTVYAAGACDVESGRSVPQPVGTLHATCHGVGVPYSSIYNLSGSVAEWDSYCTDATHCMVRGGYFGDLSGNAKCTSTFAQVITDQYSGVGFRCCAD